MLIGEKNLNLPYDSIDNIKENKIDLEKRKPINIIVFFNS